MREHMEPENGIKLCITQWDTINIGVINMIFKVAQQQPLIFGAPVRFYGEPSDYAKVFSEWGLICEKGIICSKKEDSNLYRKFGDTPRPPETSPESKIEDLCRRFQATFREEKCRQADCPFCPKDRGEHTDEELLACVDILRRKLSKKPRTGRTREPA